MSTKKTVAQLKQIQADALIFFMKIHNWHWNVKGMDFHPVHIFTDKLYEEFATIFDDTAEKVLQMGETPIVTVKDCLGMSKIKEESKECFRSKEVFEGVLADVIYFKDEFKKLSKIADSEDEDSIASYADDLVSDFEKKIWMLKASLA